MTPRIADSPFSFQIRRCIYHMRPATFSTSSVFYAQIPPESPRFCQAPRPVQPKQPFPIRIRGALPPPRPIFFRQAKGQVRKASPKYLAAVAPEPSVDRTKRTDDDFLSWKARQSELRRKNLREGLTELRQRKHEIDRKTALRRTAISHIREKLLYAQEPRDVYLTSPSILSNQRPKKRQSLPDPDRPARLAVKRQNVADMAAMREEARRSSLHSLYVNAGTFITTNEHLDGVIDRVFDDLSQFRNSSREGTNIWNLGFPETVRDLLQRVSKSGKQSAIESGEGNEVVTRERMKRISEELTGGKMLPGS